MRSAQRGKNTSDVEVTNISKHGFWLLIEGREVFVSFRDFPWFRDVNIGELLNVTMPHPHHLCWPDIDVDLDVESLEHPERYPLVSRVRDSRRL
ncbi:MAG: DUF2442 domain-containing protein [Candidatus Eisenbacteria bacterium]